MRGAFVRTLTELAEADPRILLLTGDLGFMALEPFSEKFPDRFFNVGVAEQNMVGLATGLAEAGFVPYVYSIVTFATLRPYEFIRNGPIQHQLPVRIVGVGGGMEYGQNGLSHYGLEDVGVMRLQPGLQVVTPADHRQAAAAVRATSDAPGPVYYRLGKDDKTVIPGLDGRFEIGKLQLIGEGADLAIITMGNVTREAVDAIELLRQQGISCTLAIVSGFNPSPRADLAHLLARFPIALTVEAHYLDGGVGSFVAEVVAEAGVPCRVVRCGVSTTPNGVSGSDKYLYEQYGLSATALARRALCELGK